MAYDLSPVALPFLSALADGSHPGDRALWLRIAADYLALASAPAPDRKATIAAAINALSHADEATRSAFARRLAPHAAAADALAALEALGGEAALVALADAVALPRERLNAAASGEASAPARAVAQRTDLDAALIDALIARGDADTALTLARNTLAPIDAAQFCLLARQAQEDPADRRLTNALLERTPATIEQGALFFEASPVQRVRIVGAAQRATLGRRYPAAHSPVAASVAARLERCALDSDWRRFEAALAEEFGCPAAFATRIASDPGGEPLAVALAALGAPADTTVRILAARDLHEGRDYRRIAALSRLKDALNPAAARLVMAAMIGAPTSTEAAARHRPQYDPTAHATPSRQAAGQHAASGQRAEPTPAVQRRRRAIAMSAGRRLGDERG